ncbi:MAG: hypothetical protein J1E83_13345 [Lachnospiraceae bacterium]|nr:hypothetical protein [Lachnospiraceae bacterium]
MTRVSKAVEDNRERAVWWKALMGSARTCLRVLCEPVKTGKARRNTGVTGKRAECSGCFKIGRGH